MIGMAADVQKKHGVEVGLDHLQPVLVGHLAQHVVARDAGVVDQHVEVAELLGHALDHRPGLLRIGEVGLGQQRSPAELGDLVHHLLGLGVAALVVHGHLGPFARQLQGDRPADAARRAGHQCRLAV